MDLKEIHKRLLELAKFSPVNEAAIFTVDDREHTKDGIPTSYRIISSGHTFNPDDECCEYPDGKRNSGNRQSYEVAKEDLEPFHYEDKTLTLWLNYNIPFVVWENNNLPLLRVLPKTEQTIQPVLYRHKKSNEMYRCVLEYWDTENQSQYVLYVSLLAGAFFGRNKEAFLANFEAVEDTQSNIVPRKSTFVRDL